MQHLFVDGLGGLTIVGGVVRVELGTQGRVPGKAVGNEGQESQLALMPTVSVNMPLEGFVGLAGHFQRFLEKLEKDGVIKRQNKESPTSPNFN